MKAVRNKRIKPISWWLDSLSLIVVMNYIGYRFLQSTMFDFVYTDLYKYISFCSLGIIGGLRFVLIVYSKAKDESALVRRKTIVKTLIAFCIAIPLIYVGWKHDYKFLIFIPLVSLCLYEMEASKVLKAHIALIGIMLVSTIICSLSGTVRNLVYYAWAGQYVGSYGIINTTDFASYFTFLTLNNWCVQKENSKTNSYIFMIVVVAATYAIYILTKSSTALLCGILSIVTMIWYHFDKVILQKTKRGQKLGEKTIQLTIFALPFFCIAFFFALFLFSQGNPVAVQLDRLLTNRLSVSLEPYIKYGIHLFGTDMSSIHGNGGTIIRNWSGGYGYLDVAYSMLTIRYGIIVFLVIVGTWTWTVRRAIQAKRNKIALAMMVIAFHALSEARFLDVNHNILLVMPFCSYIRKYDGKVEHIKQEQRYEIEQKNKIALIVAIVLGTIVFIFFPKIVSWLRTIFYCLEIRTGIKAFLSFCICSGILILIIGVLCYIKKLCQNRTRKTIFGFSVISLCFMACILAGNYVIQRGFISQSANLDSEENIVEIVQEAATLPVYVAEKSELYQRRFGGFEDHVFSTEELCRSPKGTIFTDSSVESLTILGRGGKYTQISPDSGVYSFDSSVISALKDAGFEWKEFYYTERTADLEDLAFRNGLSIKDNHLILGGSKQSINTNLELDQFAGSYEVRYTIELTDIGQFSDEDIICRLQVMGEAGDRLILEKVLYGSEFNMDRRCTITLTYEIEDTPKVSYLIIAEDDVKVYVDEIVWRRVL